MNATPPPPTAGLALADVLIIVLYLGFLLGLGTFLGKLVKNSKDMFAAGGQSPWWLSGISAYMTMFSSGTFVVFGAIAYKAGMVAVSISTCLGFSAALVGYFIARKWKESGATSASEYIRARFGNTAVQLYTWLGLLVRVFGVAVALYSIAVLVCALIPISANAAEGNILLRLLRDSDTGQLSVPLTIIVTGVIVVFISGNLWAVLVTDTLQFLVLGASVLIVVPMLFAEVGGISAFIEAAPEGFLGATNYEFNWVFLTGWIIVHMFKIGGEWAFVQRFLCVPKKKDAVKAAYLFGALYLFSPVIWMLPPMIFRILQPSANPEEAYILACQAVLPAGLVGLMISAMFSATVSMADSEINVYAGALTRDLYKPLFAKDCDENHLLKIGHRITWFLGAIVIGVSLAIPKLGGAQTVILMITGLFVGPLTLPAIWSLFSKRIGIKAVVWTVIVGAACSAFLKLGMGVFSVFGESGDAFIAFVNTYNRTAEVIVGIIPPVLTLVIIEWRSHTTDAGHKNIEELQAIAQEEDLAPSRIPALIMAWGCAVLAVIFLLVGFTAEHQTFWVVSMGITLSIIAALTFYLGREPAQAAERS